MARKTKEVKVEAVNPVMVKEVLPTLAEMTTEQLIAACKHQTNQILIAARVMTQEAHNLGKFLNELAGRKEMKGIWMKERAKLVPNISRQTLNRWCEMAKEPFDAISEMTLTEVYVAMGFTKKKAKNADGAAPVQRQQNKEEESKPSVCEGDVEFLLHNLELAVENEMDFTPIIPHLARLAEMITSILFSKKTKVA